MQNDHELPPEVLAAVNAGRQSAVAVAEQEPTPLSTARQAEIQHARAALQEAVPQDFHKFTTWPTDGTEDGGVTVLVSAVVECPGCLPIGVEVGRGNHHSSTFGGVRNTSPDWTPRGFAVTKKGPAVDLKRHFQTLPEAVAQAREWWLLENPAPKAEDAPPDPSPAH